MGRGRMARQGTNPHARDGGRPGGRGGVGTQPNCGLETPIPEPDDTLDYGGEVALLDAEGETAAVFNFEDFREIRDSWNQLRAWVFVVSRVDLVQPEYALASEGVRFGFSGRYIYKPVTTTTNRRIWAEIRERGASAGIQKTGDDRDAKTEVLTGEQTEEAEFLTRYDPGLAIGQRITDDLERVWDVVSTRTILDRRFLQFDGRRTVNPSPLAQPSL